MQGIFGASLHDVVLMQHSTVNTRCAFTNKLLTCTKDGDKTPTTLVCCLLLYKTITTCKNTHALEQASEKLQLSRYNYRCTRQN